MWVSVCITGRPAASSTAFTRRTLCWCRSRSASDTFKWRTAAVAAAQSGQVYDNAFLNFDAIAPHLEGLVVELGVQDGPYASFWSATATLDSQGVAAVTAVPPVTVRSPRAKPGTDSLKLSSSGVGDVFVGSTAPAVSGAVGRAPAVGVGEGVTGPGYPFRNGGHGRPAPACHCGPCRQRAGRKRADWFSGQRCAGQYDVRRFFVRVKQFGEVAQSVLLLE